MPPAPELAKLSRPRLYRVSARERLFRALDELREHPVVWVTGAPGTGKSALVASWLEARQLASVWYHIDPGDADPGTFFHYLGLAAPARGRDARPLPRYAEEYRRDHPGFTRRWFREFFARLAPGSVLVFDDFHDARTGHDERAAFAAGLEEIPAGITVVATSRGDPPRQFARLVARRAIGRLDAEALRFTRDEAGALLRAAGEADQHVIDRVWQRVDGWAAGLILLHEHAAARGRADDAGTPGPPHAVFDYFAGEILNSAAPDARRAAMVSALLPHMSVPVVTALTGHPQIGHFLDAGYRRHLFVTRTDVGEPVYQYHALFREFLLGQLRAEVPPDELAGLRRRAAELLEADGAVESAFELYRDAGDWPNAVRLTLAHAPKMITQGRVQPLAERIAALPAEERERRALARLLGRPRAHEHRAAHRAREPRTRPPGFCRARRHRRADPGRRGGDRLAVPRLGRLAADPSLGGHPAAAARRGARVPFARQRGAHAVRARDRARVLPAPATRCSLTASDGWKRCSMRSRTGRPA